MAIEILGKEEVIKTATIEKIKKFHSRGYHPNNIDLIIAGGLPKNIDNQIKEYFGNQQRGENTRKKFPRLEQLDGQIILNCPSPEQINLENPNESSAQVSLTFLAPVNGDPDEYDARILKGILGKNLFQNVGLKKGLAYRIESNFSGDYNAGSITIFSSVPVTRINEAIESIFKEMNNLKTKEVEEKSIQNINKKVEFNYAGAFESNNGHIQGIEIKLDEGLTYSDMDKKFKAVTSKTVREVANKYLPDKNTGRYILHIQNPLLK